RPIDPSNFDTTCAACTNFFEFADGGWLKRNTIPAAYASWGSFNELYDRNEAVLRQILDADAADRAAPTGSSTAKIGAYYRSCLDSTAINARGITSLEPVLARITALHTNDEVKAALGPLEHESGLTLAPFGAGVGTDDKRSDSTLVVLGQGGLGLPDRDYYLKTDARSQELRTKYVAHVARMLELAGTPAVEAQEAAGRVLALETAMARAQMSRVDMRDPNKIYHRMTLADAQRITPDFVWTRYLDETGAPRTLASSTLVNVMQPAYFAAVDTLLSREPVSTWRPYLHYHALEGAAPALPTPFAQEAFNFQRNFTGATEQLPRWKRCTAAVNNALGEMVGQEYVKRAFTPEAKTRALAMVTNLQAALGDRIRALPWMSDSTKQQALLKLGAFTKKIGYPDRWRDYSALQVVDGDYLGNRRRATLFEEARDWHKLGKPVDKTEWGMTPPTVNAYYNPTWNEIVFPAGILQPPFYDPQADDAVNYGAMGAVIGHEMTHGFDDEGRQYDAQGNLRDWWTAGDARRYNAEAQKVVTQFNAYTIVDSATHVNGSLTTGENIADFGGLTVAYAAMEKAYEGKPHTTIDGFTPEQRFFLGWAQVWRELQRPEAARAQVAVDPHSPALWRVNGPLSNMPEFKAAWHCKDGDPMVRPAEQRASIW
ncbi:MAG: M13 family metallopeptidase, partial [Candidatus Eremiobacteraeota bacterium]|nr:M13 family metallopeptidase [Candidatus Eremiobacteraeota bacterium]